MADKTETARTRIWFDTEFIEDGRTIDLISIALVRDDGAEIYMENEDCDLSRASSWVQQNVVPLLRGGKWRALKAKIAEVVREFAGPTPEFWAYYADYDWVALCQLYGTMIDLPEGWPMFCLDIKQEAYLRRVDPPPQQGAAHDALADARWNRIAWEVVTNGSN